VLITRELVKSAMLCNLITSRMHGGKKGRSLVTVGSGEGCRNLGAEVMDARVVPAGNHGHQSGETGRAGNGRRSKTVRPKNRKRWGKRVFGAGGNPCTLSVVLTADAAAVIPRSPEPCR
jgi:hypothetical protein